VSENNEKPLVSIITVCYNSEKYIRDTIESVLNQTYDNIEYIIIDGASTDNTLNIIKEYEPKFNGRMKWISESDNGIYYAMNKGIDLAKGKIIGIINSDDWYEINTIKTVVKTFEENNNIDIVYGLLRIIKNNKEFKIESTNYEFLEKKMIPHPTVFIKKIIYNKYGNFNLDYKYSADYELMLRFYEFNVNFKKIDQILTNFRVGGAWEQNQLRSSIETISIKKEKKIISTKKSKIYKIKIYLKEIVKKIIF
jgi:glycosyltransferase involved in cell wall biosynthesis